MPDAGESDGSTDVAKLLASVERHQAPDLALQSLVDMIDAFGDVLSVGITLLVHGQIVTGEAVSGRTFFEGLARNLQAPVTGDNEMAAIVRNKFTERFRTFGDTYPTFPPGDDSDEPRRSLKMTTYVHLRNAYVFVGDQGVTIPTKDGLWLRVRLSAVDGFTMGIMRASST